MVPQLKLLELVVGCGELWRVVVSCGELWYARINGVMDVFIYNSSQSLALGLGIVDVLRPIPHLRHNQRWASRLCYNMTYATWRGLHFAPPQDFLRVVYHICLINYSIDKLVTLLFFRSLFNE